jgi:valyl-tRNA synthetase
LPLNRWIIGEILQLGYKLESELEGYRFNMAAAALYQTVWGQFCDWYIEFIKPLLGEEDEEVKKEVRACAAWCVGVLSHFLHPFMPFITEEIWHHICRENPDNLLISSSWPLQEKGLEELIDESIQKNIAWVISLISGVRGLKADLNISPAVKLTLGLSKASNEATQRLFHYRSLIERLGRLEVKEGETGAVPKGAAQFIMEEATFYIPLGAHIDLKQEQQRLEKSLFEAEQDILRLQEKLKNEEFITKAPAEIIEKAQGQLQERLEQQARYQQALKSLI